MKKKSNIVIFTTVIALCIGAMAYFVPIVYKDLTKGFDLNGGHEAVYEVKPLKLGDPAPDLKEVSDSLAKRLSLLGVDDYRIVEAGVDCLKISLPVTPAIAEFKKSLAVTGEVTFRDSADQLLMGTEVVADGGAEVTIYNGKPLVSLRIADFEKFGDITEELSRRPSGENLIVTWVDFKPGIDSYQEESTKEEPRFVSVAQVSSRIDGDASIQGDFTEEKAQELADMINAGTLPAKIIEKSFTNDVSGYYGQNTFDKVGLAGLLGILAIMVCLFVFYFLPGLVTALILPIYVFVNICIYNTLGGTINLAAIVALIIGVALVADYGILTGEGIKDSLYYGRNLQKSYVEAGSWSLKASCDALVATLITALVIYIFTPTTFGGFGMMLILVVLSALIFNVVIYRWLFGLLVNSGMFDDKLAYFRVKQEHIPDVIHGEERKYFPKYKDFDFVKLTKKMVLSGLVVILAAVVTASVKTAGKNEVLDFGVDFVNSTTVYLICEPLSEKELKADLKELGYRPDRIQMIGEDGKAAILTFKDSIKDEDLLQLKETIKELYHHDADIMIEKAPTSSNFAEKLYMLVLVIWLAILLYVTFRFGIDYAIGSLVAIIHDILIVAAVFVIGSFKVNTEFFVLLLAVVVYSVYDSLVIFAKLKDKIKAITKKQIDKEDYRAVVNESIMESVARSTNKIIVAALPLILMACLAGSGLVIFDLGMIAAVVFTSCSSLFIAAMLWLWFRQNSKPKVKAKPKKKKKKNEPTEMTFVGINEIK